jgi:cytoskeleton protein RodZ
MGRVFEIGNSLREARTRKGLDFPELEQGTKIRAKYLRALEDEAFETLPSATYVKGFLRTYADYLGLDGQLYVDEYNVRYGSGDEVLERRVRSASPSRRTHVRRRRRFESKLVWLTLLGIAVLTALVIAAWRYGGSGHQSLPLDTPATTAATKAPRGGLVVRAVGGNTLLLVRSGSESGRQVWNGTLTNGSMQRFGTGKRLWVYIGSPENVRMRLNGRGVLVGGSRPRSLIVTSGNIVSAGPGT